MKQFGYESCEHYYQESSLDFKIQNINIPTLFLNSKDDMFAPYKSYPIEKIKSNPYTGMILTKYGGKQRQLLKRRIVYDYIKKKININIFNFRNFLYHILLIFFYKIYIKGHIAWCEGLYPLGCNYTCRMLNDYLKYVLAEIDEKNRD